MHQGTTISGGAFGLPEILDNATSNDELSDNSRKGGYPKAAGGGDGAVHKRRDAIGYAHDAQTVHTGVNNHDKVQ
jgi:hypothetical protein